MKLYTSATLLLLVAVALMAAGCKAQRPVLYPNSHLEQVGGAAAQADIDDCIAQATAAGADPSSGDSGEKIATSAAVGAAAGAVFGAIMGDRDVVRTAAATGGAAAAGTAVGEASRSGTPDNLHKNFVNKCLAKKGYEVVGWK